MNNSFIAIENVSLELDEPVDNTIQLRQEETKLAAIIEAINIIAATDEWKVLKEKVFDGVVDSLKRERETEVEKQPINGPKVHNINGQLRWARKYLDLSSFANIYKQELINIRKQLNAKGN
jgi:hypothetical protein